jgi:hypothetical protein
VIFVTYRSGPRESNLRTVLLEGSKPRHRSAVLDGKLQPVALCGTLAEGRFSALAWWNTEVHGRAADDRTFEIPAELVRKVRAA